MSPSSRTNQIPLLVKLLNYLYLVGACGILILISGGGVWCLTSKSFSMPFRIFLCAAYAMVIAALGFRTSSEFNDGRGDIEEYALIGIGVLSWILIFLPSRDRKVDKKRSN